MRRSIGMMVSIAVLASCSPRKSEDRVRRSVIRIAVTHEIQPLHPVLTTHGVASVFSQILADTLISEMDGEPLIADSIKSEDYISWEVHLRPNVFFHDGSAVEARHVLLSLAFARSPSAPDFYRDRLQEIDSAEEISSRSVTLRLRRPNPKFPSNLIFPILRDPEKFSQNPVGSGPYRLVDYSPKAVRLAAFDQYYRGKPQTSEVRVTFYPSSEESWVHFIRGEVDLMLDSSIAVESLKQISASIEEHIVEPPYGYAVGFTVRNGVLGNPEFRRALALGTNLRRLGRLFGNTSPPPPHWSLGERLPSDNSESVFDPEAAGRILDRMGWKRSADGFIRTRGTDRLGLPLYYFGMDEASARIARSISRDLFDLGIDVTLHPAPLEEVRKAMSGSIPLAAVFYYPPRSGPERLHDLFHSSQIHDGANAFGYSVPQVDRWLDSARAEPGFEKQRLLYDRVFRRVEEDIPGIFLLWRNRSIPMDRCWKNVSIRSGDFLGTLWRWKCEEPSNVH